MMHPASYPDRHQEGREQAAIDFAKPHSSGLQKLAWEIQINSHDNWRRKRKLLDEMNERHRLERIVMEDDLIEEAKEAAFHSGYAVRFQALSDEQALRFALDEQFAANAAYDRFGART